MAITRRRNHEILVGNSRRLRSGALHHPSTVNRSIAHQPAQIRRKCAPQPSFPARPAHIQKAGGLEQHLRPAAGRNHGGDRGLIAQADQVGGQTSDCLDGGSSLPEGENTAHGDKSKASDAAREWSWIGALQWPTLTLGRGRRKGRSPPHNHRRGRAFRPAHRS